MPNPTLIDLVRLNGSDGQVGLIDDAIRAHPELTLGAARTIKGTSFKTLVRTALPNTGGSFRKANAGSLPLKSTYENRTVETYILEPRIEADKAVANAYEDGWESYFALEAQGIMEGEMQGLSRQFYYGFGTNGNTDGPPGLIQAYDATNMVVDAGGTSANTGSSVWFVEFGPRAVQWVWGAGLPFNFSPVRVESIIDANDSTKKFDGYVQTMVARPGVQVGSTLGVVRIKKLTADNGKGLTDALISKALAKYPAGHSPSVCLMTRRSLEQLRSSRTATNPTGAPAPFPADVLSLAGETVPIRVTDAILDTEALTL